MTDKSPDNARRFVGIALVVSAVLWTAFCGSCALFFGLVGPPAIGGTNEDILGLALQIATLVAIVGGCVVFFVGLNLLRRKI